MKGQEIAKIQSVQRTKRKGFDIEIVEIRPIDGGAEVFVRAWNDKGQIGFGNDGTVDIERIKIFDPPYLVDDPNGDVVIEWFDILREQDVRLTFREDPKEALWQSLEHTLIVMKNKHDDSKIVQGKRGNTTSTFYSAAGANSPVDGLTTREVGTAESFSTLRNGSGTAGSPSNIGNDILLRTISASSGNFNRLYRSIFGFNTSTRGSDTITSATLSFMLRDSSSGLGAMTWDVVDASPASASNIVSADYQNSFGTTRMVTSVPLASWNAVDVYTDMPLNATGIAYINKSGNTFFGSRSTWDTDNNFTGSHSSSAFSFISPYSADNASGTSKAQKLVVEHSVAVTFNPVMMHHMQIAGGLM